MSTHKYYLFISHLKAVISVMKEEERILVENQMKP